MGAPILRFKREDDGKELVVKLAPRGTSTAALDIAANIKGYEEIRKLGGEDLLPPDLGIIETTKSVGLVMCDLGLSVRTKNEGKCIAQQILKHFDKVIEKTVQITEKTETPPAFVTEVLRHLGSFSSSSVFIAYPFLRGSDILFL